MSHNSPRSSQHYRYLMIFTIAICGLMRWISRSSLDTQSPIANDQVAIQINGHPVYIGAQSGASTSGIMLYTPSLTTEHDTLFTNITHDKSVRISIDNKPLITGLSLRINNLSNTNTIPIQITQGNQKPIQYLLQTLPYSFPQTDLSGQSPYSGDYYSNYLNDKGHSYIYKMNNGGEVVYYYQGYYNGNGSVGDFKKHTIDNVTYYSFFEPTKDKGIPYHTGINLGSIVLMDASYKVINTIKLIPTSIVPQGGWVENHDFILINKDHYIVTAAFLEDIPISGAMTTVWTNYIQEVQDGKVLFEWTSKNHPEFIAHSVEGNKRTHTGQAGADYIHINSIAIDPKDNNIIVGFRHQDAIIKLDRQSGKILWTLGGKGDEFGLSTEQKFSRQHDAHYLKDGSILIFDNGMTRGQTRIVKLKIDETNKKLIDYQSFQKDGMFSLACGSVQALDEDNNIYLIGRGISAKRDKTVATEIDFRTNKTLSEITSANGQRTYRTLKFK